MDKPMTATELSMQLNESQTRIDAVIKIATDAFVADMARAIDQQILDLYRDSWHVPYSEKEGSATQFQMSKPTFIVNQKGDKTCLTVTQRIAKITK